MLLLGVTNEVFDSSLAANVILDEAGAAILDEAGQNILDET